MYTIWKYELQVTDEQKILMPANAKILSIQVQDGKPFVWALIYPNNDNEERTFFTYGTGNPIKLFGQENYFLGTYQLRDGRLVFHVFYF